MTGKLLQDSARDFVTALGWLVGIGRGAECNCFSTLDSTQVVPRQFRRVLLDVDFLLELPTITHFHEFVRVAGIAVFAGELTAAVGIGGPGERQPSVTDATVQQGTSRQSKVLNIVALAKRSAFRREAGNAYERRLLGNREQGTGARWGLSYSPFVRL
jgi:hypothetical protein